MADVERLQSAIEYWKNLNFTDFQKELETLVSDIATRLEQSETSRKKLIEQTREFKKTFSEDVAESVAPLLRSFQTEIDSISKCSKLAESKFLSVYKQLVHMPDMLPIIDGVIVHKALSVDGENRTSDPENKHRIEADELNEKQNLLIKELSIKVDFYEAHMASLVQIRVQQKEKELEENFEQKVREMQGMETSILEKLRLTEHHAGTLQCVLKSAISELAHLKAKLDAPLSSPALNLDHSSGFPVDLSSSDQADQPSQSSRNETETKPIVGNVCDSVAPNEIKFNSSQSSADVLNSTTKAACATSEVRVKRRRRDKRFKNKELSIRPFSLDRCSSAELPSTSPAVSSKNKDLVGQNCTGLGLSESLVPFPSSFPVSFFGLTSGPSPSFVLPNLQYSCSPSPSTSMNDSVSKLSPNLSLSAHCPPFPSSASLWCLPPDVTGLVKSENGMADALDTIDVAQRIRDILATHNIGQRQFARQVLGLSQGTVSELLSKPKPWDKLTEKGRESYRKMQIWAKDETNFLELKLSTLKNGHNTFNSGYPLDESSVTEQRISQILLQAQAAIHGGQEAPKVCLSSPMNEELNLKPKHCDPIQNTPSREKSAAHHQSNSQGNFAREVSGLNSAKRSVEKNDNTSLSSSSQSFVVRIYREQLLELIQAAETNGNAAEVERYRSELDRISSISTDSNSKIKKEPEMNRIENKDELPSNKTKRNQEFDIPEDLSICRSLNHSSTSTISNEKENQMSNVTSSRPTSAGLTSLTESHSSDDLSPLEQMQYIANSLVSKSPQSVPTSSGLSAGRTALPPIGQDQWDKCADLNTDDIVQRVKELLSEYSISQRLFGEHVLGLSQGSVSDLLARPKPWYMLTQKGREPFVRMKCFLDEPSSVHNLVSNQYRIPADKFLRSNSTAFSDVVVPAAGSVKRRKSSIEDNLSDSQSSQKKPRVSFTEEQKDSLHAAYDADPYPAQGIIDQLAADLGVSEKTIINWFHNHRMRDKNRFATAWSPSNSSPGNMSHWLIKTEDQSSQSCDSSPDLGTRDNMMTADGEFIDPTDPSESSTNFRKDASVVESFSSSFAGASSSAEDPALGDSEEMGDAEDRLRKEAMKGVSKRKSARPQRLSTDFVLDKFPNLSSAGLVNSSACLVDGVALISGSNNDKLERVEEVDHKHQISLCDKETGLNDECVQRNEQSSTISN